MTTSQSGRPATVPLSLLVTGYNPRRFFDQKKHEEMVASMRLRGVLQPLLVRPAPDAEGFYAIVAGGRRYRAALEAFGQDGDVPVNIREMTDQEALEAAMDENDIRDDVSETEQADAAVRQLAACNNDHAEAIRRLGWSRSKFDRRLALANLSDTVKTALNERRIKLGHAELLAAVPSDKQDKALETILNANLDIGKTRDLLMRVTQSLANAIFDKTECTTCKFNSGTQRALFETHVDDGYCTNAGCFALKTETVEKAREEEAARAAAATAQAEADRAGPDEDDDPAEDSDEHTGDEIEIETDPVAPADSDAAATAPRATATAPKPASSGAVLPTTGGAKGPSVTVTSLAARTVELREATWRTALARALADNPDHAQAAILVAALTGTLSQIKSNTLTMRAALLTDPTFPDLAFRAKIDTICDLSAAQAQTARSAIGAAYAKDVQTFDHVADLARAFGVDIRERWQVDRAFLERYTKDELKFIGQECGLVAHMGERAFARLLASKKPDLVTGMLNALGFHWEGRLPSCMTLDRQYGPPLSDTALQAEPAPAPVPDAEVEADADADADADALAA